MRLIPYPRSFRWTGLVLVATILHGCSDSASVVGSSDSAAASPSVQAGEKPTQVAARVNAEELTVHQLNDRLAVWSPGVDRSRMDDPALGRTLNGLVELTLLRQEAEAQGLAQKPEVLRQLQAARAEVLARALAQQIGDEEPPPAPHVVRRYYDEHPQAYAKRRVFHLQELRSTLPTKDGAKVLQRLGEFRQPQGLARALELEHSGQRSAISALQVTSEQLSDAQLQRLQKLPQGQALLVDNSQGLRVWWLQAAVDQPIEWAQAQPAIERALAGQARAERLRRELERLRSQSKVEFVGDFARWAPAAAASVGSSEASTAAGSTGSAGSTEAAQDGSTKSAAR